MDNKKVIGGLALGIISVVVLGFILAFVVFGNNKDTDRDENSQNQQTLAADNSIENTQTTEDESLETIYEEAAEETAAETQEITAGSTESATDDIEAVESTEPVENNSTDTDNSEEAVSEDKKTVFGNWVPLKVVDGMSGEEISFREAFGNDFYELDNYLKLSENGTFELALGTIKTEDQGEGSFSILEDTIEITYGDGKQDIFKLEKDIDGSITYILVPKYNFTVYFQRS